MEIRHNGSGYKISLKDGTRGGYYASTVDEIILSVEHYYCGGDRGHMRTSHKDCPLCKAQVAFAAPQAS